MAKKVKRKLYKRLAWAVVEADTKYIPYVAPSRRHARAKAHLWNSINEPDDFRVTRVRITEVR